MNRALMRLKIVHFKKIVHFLDSYLLLFKEETQLEIF